MGILGRLFGGGKARKREELLVNIITDVDPQTVRVANCLEQLWVA
jgi:hypothetical protein